MDIKTTHCDKCGRTGAKKIYYNHDRKQDGAGSMEDVYDQKDLCLDCLVKLTNDISKLSRDSDPVHTRISAFMSGCRWQPTGDGK